MVKKTLQNQRKFGFFHGQHFNHLTIKPGRRPSGQEIVIRPACTRWPLKNNEPLLNSNQIFMYYWWDNCELPCVVTLSTVVVISVKKYNCLISTDNRSIRTYKTLDTTTDKLTSSFFVLFSDLSCAPWLCFPPFWSQFDSKLSFTTASILSKYLLWFHANN